MSKLCLLFVLTGIVSLSASVRAQYNQQVSLTMNGATIGEVLVMLEKQTQIKFIYDRQEVAAAGRIDVEASDCNVLDFLSGCLRGTGLTYVLQNEVIIIKPAPQEQSQTVPVEVKGVVRDTDDKPIVGVTVMNRTSGRGAATDTDGKFSVQARPNDVFTFTYVGKSAVEIVYTGQATLNVVLRDEAAQIEEVVVTGYFTRSKESYTGSVKTISGEELRQVSSTNIITAIAALTPGLNIVERSESGSNPNKVPELLLRGMSSFSDGTTSVNQPTIILDGVEISMSELYDLDINEIETITTLKDASATALYGSRAASGVIVVERKKLTEGNMRVAYNFTSNVQFPYLKDYDLLNASEKLEYERLAGLYTAKQDQWGSVNMGAEQYKLDKLYNERYQEVVRGVDSDWLAQPSRTAFSHDHSIRLYGGASNIRYELNGRFNNTQGVMKADYRRRYGLGFKLQFHATDKLTFANRTSWHQVDSKDTPYGSISSYTNMNPYDRIFDEYGNPNINLSWGLDNPLHEASIGNFNRNTDKILSNTTDIRWEINKLFRVTANFNISITDGIGERFTSPNSQTFKDETDISKKGSLQLSNSNSVTYSGVVTGAFNKVTDGNSLISVVAGMEANRNRSSSSSVMGLGYYDDALAFIGQGAGYPATGAPGGTPGISAEAGGFLNATYMYDNRYFIDGIYRISGSSKFGSNNRYGHFWSMGLGWNLHNESFIGNFAIDLWKIRSSVGYTGKAKFEPFQAMTIYKYLSDYEYKNGIGAVPQTIGNDDLRWERELSWNLGMDLSLFDRWMNMTIDFYIKRTKDLVLDVSKAPSSGVTTAKSNIGEMQNKGFEFQIDGYIINHNDRWWKVGMTGYTNRNKILKISNALEAQNTSNNAVVSIRPLGQYEEGESISALKVVRSAGIDPATGKEVYCTLDGQPTFDYSPDYKVVVGDTEPSFSGTVHTSAFYKGFSLFVYGNFRWGGYIYNTTRATRVEGSNPMSNADRRVFTSRWKNPGDIAMYKDIADTSTPNHTDRFVEKDNVFALGSVNLGYQFDQELCKRLGLRNLRAGINFTDILRLSNVKIERGTGYLYSNGFEITLNATF